MGRGDGEGPYAIDAARQTHGRLIKLRTPYSSRVVGNRLGARLANDSATFFGPPVR